MSSDSEVENEETAQWKGVSGTVILINTYDPINLGTGTTSFKATCRLLQNYMRSSNSQQIGVCFYGTKETHPSSLGIESVCEIIPLTLPTLTDYMRLQNKKISEYGQATDFKLSDVLWHCNKMFANCKKLLSNKTVIMLTRLDIAPVESDQKPALKRVIDLVESGVRLTIINVSENTYQVDEFYKNLLVNANKGGEYVLPNPIWDCEKIVNLMHVHSHRHIAVAKLSFELGHGFSIGVGVFKLLQSETKPKKVTIDKETNQLVTSITTTTKVSYNNDNIDADDMDIEAESVPREVPLLKSELLHYQTFGGEKVEFTNDEMKKLRNPFGPPMMKLLGFKPASIICKEKWFMKASQFLFPTENLIEGSTVAFKALHKACTEMTVIAICVLCTRVNSRPCIVALSPCTKPLGLEIKIGFDIIYIPFVENVREVPPNENPDKTLDSIHKVLMKDVIKDLCFDYKADELGNPSLQTLYNALEALALEKEDVDPIVDSTKPDIEMFRNIDADLFDTFGPFGSDGLKRPVAAAKSSSSNKRERVDNIDDSTLETRLSSSTVEEYTVAELKQILKAKEVQGLPALTGLKKAQLVELVYKNLKK